MAVPRCFVPGEIVQPSSASDELKHQQVVGQCIANTGSLGNLHTSNADTYSENRKTMHGNKYAVAISIAFVYIKTESGTETLILKSD